MFRMTEIVILSCVDCRCQTSITRSFCVDIKRFSDRIKAQNSSLKMSAFIKISARLNPTTYSGHGFSMAHFVHQDNLRGEEHEKTKQGNLATQIHINSGSFDFLRFCIRGTSGKMVCSNVYAFYD